MIVSLAKFHDVSYLYGEKYTKKAYYNVKYKCNGIELNKILLGFKEKYYLYPIAKVDRNDIKELYDLLYSEFILYYYNEDCIIHNDVSINNMYFHNEDVCIIDFDFSTKGSIYVDFVDLIIKRTYSISDIVEYLLETNNLEKYIDIYNSNSIKFHLEYKGCLLMIGLKVLAYNYYVLSEVDSKDLFDKKMLEIKKLLELLKGRYYGN